jgi:DNA-binding Xre family transcriptional regulator
MDYKGIIKVGISYKPLFVLLAQKGMKKTDLCEKLGISPTTLAKFSKNEYVSGETIEKICIFFHCQPNDVYEVIVEAKDE